MSGTREDAYPSRRAREPALLPRRDPVVHGAWSADAPLTREQTQAFERDGFLVLRELFTTPEIDALAREADALRTSRSRGLEAETVIAEPGSGAVRSVFRVHAQSEVFARLAADERLADVARFLLADDVYLHQTRMNYKPGFEGKEFYWHSDFETWHVEDGMPLPRALSISVSLTDNTPHNGPLLVMPGSHRHYVVCEGETPPENYQMSLQAQEIGVPGDEHLEWLANQAGLVDTAGPAGSILIFDCNLMHGSNSNITHLPRSNAFFVYNAMSNAVQAPFCDQAPRPEFIATRQNISALKIGTNV